MLRIITNMGFLIGALWDIGMTMLGLYIIIHPSSWSGYALNVIAVLFIIIIIIGTPQVLNPDTSVKWEIKCFWYSAFGFKASIALLAQIILISPEIQTMPLGNIQVDIVTQLLLHIWLDFDWVETVLLAGMGSMHSGAIIYISQWWTR